MVAGNLLLEVMGNQGEVGRGLGGSEGRVAKDKRALGRQGCGAERVVDEACSHERFQRGREGLGTQLRVAQDRPGQQDHGRGGGRFQGKLLEVGHALFVHRGAPHQEMRMGPRFAPRGGQTGDGRSFRQTGGQFADQGMLPAAHDQDVGRPSISWLVLPEQV